MPDSQQHMSYANRTQHDGIVVIFDIETNGVARKLRGHTRQVQSLSWSTNDRYLLSAGQEWKCVLWDLQDGSRVRTVRFEAAIFIAELHPKNQSVVPKRRAIRF